jgi:hypothetical protein
MQKKITMTARPSAASPQADSWVKDKALQGTPTGPTKRLTIDIPEDQHTRFKSLCAIHKTKMVEEVTRFIAQRISELERQGKAL